MGPPAAVTPRSRNGAASSGWLGVELSGADAPLDPAVGAGPRDSHAGEWSQHAAVRGADLEVAPPTSFYVAPGPAGLDFDGACGVGLRRNSAG
jgi:hypothetical protein